MATSKLYLLQDGTYASLKDLSKDKDGVLRNEAGVGVVFNDDGEPTTIGDANATNAKAAGQGQVEAFEADPVVTEVQPSPETNNSDQGTKVD